MNNVHPSPLSITSRDAPNCPKYGISERKRNSCIKIKISFIMLGRFRWMSFTIDTDDSKLIRLMPRKDPPPFENRGGQVTGSDVGAGSD